MIWGLTLPPGQPYSVTVEEEVQLSMVALESRGNYGAYNQVPVQITIRTGKAEHLLCTLVHGQLYQQIVDIKLSPREKVVFCAHGTGLVHVTGYTRQFAEDDMFDDVYQEAEPPDDDPGPQPSVDDAWQPMATGDNSDIVEDDNIAAPVSRVSRVHSSGPVYEENISISQIQDTDVVGPNAITEPEMPSHEIYGSTTEQSENYREESFLGIGKEEVDVKEESDVVEIILHGSDSNMSSPRHHSGSSLSSPISTTPTKQTSAVPSTSSPHPIRLQRGMSQPSTSAVSQTFGVSTHLEKSHPKRNPFEVNTREFDTDHILSGVWCTTCKLKFVTAEQLRSHELSKFHNRRERHKCAICHRGFLSKRDLVRHERIHSNSKPFICSVCHASFSQKGSLKRHEIIHTKYFQLECRYCQLRFRHNADCVRHMNICYKRQRTSQN